GYWPPPPAERHLQTSYRAVARVAAVLRRPAFALVAATCGVLAVSVAPAPAATPGCPRLKETSLHWDAVFAHVSSLSEAQVLEKRLQHFGYKNVTFEKDWCDDVEIAVPGLD